MILAKFLTDNYSISYYLSIIQRDAPPRKKCIENCLKCVSIYRFQLLLIVYLYDDKVPWMFHVFIGSFLKGMLKEISYTDTH